MGVKSLSHILFDAELNIAITCYCFYRATLCVSAFFAVARCLSVRLSYCHVGALYPDGWRYRQLLSRPGSNIILVFCLRVPIPKSKGNPFSRGAKYTGGGKI